MVIYFSAPRLEEKSDYLSDFAGDGFCFITLKVLPIAS
jgi:hypothetical protein